MFTPIVLASTISAKEFKEEFKYYKSYGGKMPEALWKKKYERLRYIQCLPEYTSGKELPEGLEAESLKLCNELLY